MGSTILTMKTLTHKIIIYSSCLLLVGWSQPSISYDDIKSLGDGLKAKLPQSAMFDTIFKSEDTTELVDNLFHMALTPMKCVIETVDQKEFDELLIEAGIDSQSAKPQQGKTNKTTPVMDKLDKQCGSKVKRAKNQMTKEIENFMVNAWNDFF